MATPKQIYVLFAWGIRTRAKMVFQENHFNNSIYIKPLWWWFRRKTYPIHLDTHNYSITSIFYVNICTTTTRKVTSYHSWALHESSQPRLKGMKLYTLIRKTKTLSIWQMFFRLANFWIQTEHTYEHLSVVTLAVLHQGARRFALFLSFPGESLRGNQLEETNYPSVQLVTFQLI